MYIYICTYNSIIYNNYISRNSKNLIYFMKFKNIIIKKKDGIKFAKQSGDKNKLHLDQFTGYNSQFGQNIIHGSYLLIKFLMNSKIKDFNSIKINFLNGLLYNYPIKIKKIKTNKNNNIFRLSQNNEHKCSIDISKKKIDNIFKIEKKTFYKKFFINKRIRKLFDNKGIDKELNLSLNFLSKYVGMIYPGEHSLISEIQINRNDSSNNNEVKIYSLKPSSRHPIVYNNLYYKKFDISFKTLIRPKLIIKNNKNISHLLKSTNKINKNILIIGASRGIGSELFNLFKDNNNKKIICTYNKNKISYPKKNVIFKKINIEKDLNKIFSIIETYKPLIIYYFPTPKINLRNNSSKYLKIYKKFYITIPIKIIKKCILNKCFFFYPSSIFVDKLQNNNYTQVKKKAEEMINKIKNSEFFINILRIPEVNTMQNLSVLNNDLPNFIQLINKDIKFKNKVFFKDLI